MIQCNFFAIALSVALCLSNLVNATSIADSLRAAYKYNPEFLKSVTSVEIQKEQSLSDLSKFLPNISFQSQRSTSKDRNPQTKNTINRSDSTNNSNTYQINQNIFNGGEDYAKLMAGKILISAKEYAALDIQQQVFLKVIQSHLNVIAQKKIVIEYQKNLAYLEKTLKAEEEKFNAGLTRATDLSATKSKLEAGKAQLASAIAQMEVEESQYKVLTGIDPLELEMPSIVAEVQADVPGLYAQATKTNLALQSSKLAYDASEIVSKSAFSTFLPNISFQYQYSKSSNSRLNPVYSRLYETYTKNRTAIATVNVPIFQGGAEYAQYRLTKLQASQARLDYIAALANTESTVKQAWFQFGATKSALKAYQEASKASKAALDGINESYNEGLVSITDLLDALKEDVNNNVNLINAHTSMIVRFYQVKAVTGELTADTMGLNDQADDAKNERSAEQ
jgi:outer membrane protein